MSVSALPLALEKTNHASNTIHASPLVKLETAEPENVACSLTSVADAPSPILFSVFPSSIVPYFVPSEGFHT